VGIGTAHNAGLLAIRILARGDIALTAALDAHRAALAELSRAKDATLQRDEPRS
jgi:phosphoribosylcarboxyaminoimidazole (NCAIR) mutase